MKLIKSILYDRINHSLRSRIEAEIEYIEIDKYINSLFDDIAIPLINMIEDTDIYNQLKIDIIDAKPDE